MKRAFSIAEDLPKYMASAYLRAAQLMVEDLAPKVTSIYEKGVLTLEGEPGDEMELFTKHVLAMSMHRLKIVDTD